MALQLVDLAPPRVIKKRNPPPVPNLGAASFFLCRAAKRPAQECPVWIKRNAPSMDLSPTSAPRIILSERCDLRAANVIAALAG